jgi:hypothetical protein
MEWLAGFWLSREHLCCDKLAALQRLLPAMTIAAIIRIRAIEKTAIRTNWATEFAVRIGGEFRQ